jgi:hypothetical protein
MRQIYHFFADAAQIALQSIWSQKLRAFLTLLGVIFGVASVVVMGASDQRIQRLTSSAQSGESLATTTS